MWKGVCLAIVGNPLLLKGEVGGRGGGGGEDLSKIESLGEGQNFLLERDDKSEKEGSM